jgi:hypothetical protein
VPGDGRSARERARRRDAVAKVDDARAERALLHELQVQALVEGGKVRRSAADRDRADEQSVLVDEAELRAAGGKPAPPTARSLPGWAFSSATMSATPSLLNWALPSTRSSVREKTIFGRAFQMCANSSTCSGADGSSSAVSQ